MKNSLFFSSHEDPVCGYPEVKECTEEVYNSLLSPTDDPRDFPEKDPHTVQLATFGGLFFRFPIGSHTSPEEMIELLKLIEVSP